LIAKRRVIWWRAHTQKRAARSDSAPDRGWVEAGDAVDEGSATDKQRLMVVVVGGRGGRGNLGSRAGCGDFLACGEEVCASFAAARMRGLADLFRHGLPPEFGACPL